MTTFCSDCADCIHHLCCLDGHVSKECMYAELFFTATSTHEALTSCSYLASVAAVAATCGLSLDRQEVKLQLKER